MRKPSTGDVTVIGLVSSGHYVEDIRVHVPYGMEVTVPAEQALRSKDIWRAVSQKCVLKVDKNSPLYRNKPHYNGTKSEEPQLQGKVEELTRQLQVLEKENSKLKDNLSQGMSDQAAKLDTILAALQNGVQMSPQAVSQHQKTVSSQKNEDVVDGDAPTFLPSQIKPEGIDARIDIEGKASDSGVSSAAEKLRALRKKKKG